MSTARLIDGTEVDSSSEAWRHECEARAIAALPSLEQRRHVLRGVEEARGKAAADALRETMRKLWEARRGA